MCFTNAVIVFQNRKAGRKAELESTTPHFVRGRLLLTLCTDVKGYGFPADFSER